MVSAPTLSPGNPLYLPAPAAYADSNNYSLDLSA